MAKYEHDSELFGYINLETLEGAQQALSKLGHDPGKVDGRDGPNTKNAVREFQARTTIQIDGIVGPETRQALMEELQRRATEGSAKAST